MFAHSTQHDCQSDPIRWRSRKGWGKKLKCSSRSVFCSIQSWIAHYFHCNFTQSTVSGSKSDLWSWGNCQPSDTPQQCKKKPAQHRSLARALQQHAISSARNAKVEQKRKTISVCFSVSVFYYFVITLCLTQRLMSWQQWALFCFSRAHSKRTVCRQVSRNEESRRAASLREK